MMQLQALLLCVTSLIPAALGSPTYGSNFPPQFIIERDIAIIGGGASGTHAAIRLRDSGQSVVVVEKDVAMGGNAQTITTRNGQRVNYGVSSYQNNSAVRSFFDRMGIPLVPFEEFWEVDTFTNFDTGLPVEEGTVPVPDLSAYIAEAAKYPYLRTGWDLPDPVPEDLLLPFGEFVEKYDLQDEAYTIAQLAIGNGNVLNQTTIYVMSIVDVPFLEAIFGTAIAANNFDTQELYSRAQEELGSDVLLSSTVDVASRSDRGVRLVVSTPNGRRLIIANKLLITAPPTVENLLPFLLDRREYNLFSQFEFNGIYVALLENTGLDPDLRYFNTDPNMTYALPQFPAPQIIWPTTDNDTFWVWYMSPGERTEAEVTSDSIAAIQNIAPGGNATVVAYDSHTPAGVGVSADKIRNRFYDDLLSLQGYRNTWYTGSTWVSDHSAALWNHTDNELLPMLL